MAVLDRLLRRPSRAPSPAREFRSLVAAGQRIDLSQKKAVQALIRRQVGWQAEAFSYFHSVGELKYAARFQGNVLSRAKFFPAIVDPGSDMPIPVELAPDLPPGLAPAALDEMGRLGDFNQLIRRLVVQWQVPGEGFLIGRMDGDEEVWEIASRSQLTKTRYEDTLELRYSADDKEGVPINRAQDVLVRLWQEDEEWPGMADSPMHSLLYEIEELLILGRHIRSVGRSRLANGSILTLPSELSYGPGEEQASPDGVDGAQRSRYAARIQEAFIEPIHDEGTAAAVAPIIIEGAHKYLDKVGYVEMPRSIDPVIDGRIEKLFVRFARSWNLPPERLLGMAGTTFANASQVERNEWDAHLAPLGEQMGLSIAKGWLRSSLQERGFSQRDVRPLTISVDPARAVTNPTIATDAKDAHKALAITDETLRRSLGFDEGDAPSAEEYARRAAILRGSVDSVLTAELLATLLQQVLGRESIVVSDQPTTEPDTSEEKEERRERDAPPASKDGGQDVVPQESSQAVIIAAAGMARGEQLGRELADLERTLTQRVLLAADAAVLRGLEKAGSRLRAAVQSKKALATKVKGLPPDQVGIALGREALVTCGIDEDKLIAGVLTDQEERYLQWIGGTQEHGVTAVAQALGWSESRTKAVLSKLREPRERSWAALIVALSVLIRSRLFDRQVEPGEGEWDLTLAAPAAYIRGALAIAGGHAPYELTPWLPPPTTGRFTGGALLGPVLQHELLSDGVTTRGWIWNYGTVPRVPFLPHRALAGVVVSTVSDVSLANTAAFPRFGSYFPGDHAGCVCDVIQLLQLPEVAA